MKADLHVHTTASDGRFSPEEVVEKAAQRGLSVLSITDHDTINGIEPALLAVSRYPGLTLVPGVEVSTDVPDGEIHVLGYFIDYRDRELALKLEQMRDSRINRGRRMVEKLADLGLHIEWERVQSIAGSGSIGRPHVAQALLEKGLVSSAREAFDKYIGRAKPAYVERDKMTPEEVVIILAKSGGLPVLAHPADIPDLEQRITQLQRVGLVGMEVYYSSYNERTVKQLAALASKYNLVATGGSDFHGHDEAHETGIGDVPIPPECVEKLFTLARQRAGSTDE